MRSQSIFQLQAMAKESIGIFGGSFNPIHIGHLALANYLCEYGDLDEVWFMVSPQNPFKRDSKLWDDELRLELAHLAVEGYPKFKVCDIEFHLPRPSYTINTLNTLKEQYPDKDFTLIIGADNWSMFPRWRSADEIISQYKVLIYPRPGFTINAEELPSTIRLVNTPQLEVSSTFIRESLEAGKDVRYFLHPKVWERISLVE